MSFWRVSNPKILVPAIIVVISVLWAVVIPWTWSTIDDPMFVIGIQDSLLTSNYLTVVWNQFAGAVIGEPAWGVFRPSYWVYQSVVYVFPIDVIHGMRMAMFLVAIAGSLVFIRRRGASGKQVIFAAALLGIAAAPLSMGLIFLSLQELSGAAFVGLGLMVSSPRKRTVMWVIAAWFKSPFAWLLLGYSIILWRTGRKKLALVNAGFGAVTLLVAVYFSRIGSYTAPRSRDSLWAIMDAFYTNMFKVFETPTALLLAVLVWWLLWTNSRIRFRPMAIVFGIGWLGYTTQMTQWEVTSYYFGPILLLLGAVLVLSLSSGKNISNPRFIAGISLALVILVIQTGGAIRNGLSTNGALISATECLQEIGSKSYALAGEMHAVVTIEGADRIVQLVQLKDRSWDGQILFEDGSGVPLESSEYAIVFGKQESPPGYSSTSVCGTDPVSIFPRNMP